MLTIRVCYIEAFLREFDRDSAGSLKKCPLLPGVRYIACPLWTGLAVIQCEGKFDVERGK